MSRVIWVVVAVLATTMALVALAVGAVEPPLPDLEKLERVGGRMAVCPDGFFYMTGYNQPGTSTDEMELMTYSTDAIAPPYLYMIWKPDSTERIGIILALPGKPRESLTIDELKARYPGPCDLRNAVTVPL